MDPDAKSPNGRAGDGFGLWAWGLWPLDIWMGVRGAKLALRLSSFSKLAPWAKAHEFKVVGGKGKAILACDFFLKDFKRLVLEFDLLPACLANQVVVVGPTEDGLVGGGPVPGFLAEGGACDKPRFLQGRKVTVDGGHGHGLTSAAQGLG